MKNLFLKDQGHMSYNPKLDADESKKSSESPKPNSISINRMSSWDRAEARPWR